MHKFYRENFPINCGSLRIFNQFLLDFHRENMFCINCENCGFINTLVVYPLQQVQQAQQQQQQQQLLVTPPPPPMPDFEDLLGKQSFEKKKLWIIFLFCLCSVTREKLYATIATSTTGTNDTFSIIRAPIITSIGTTTTNTRFRGPSR